MYILLPYYLQTRPHHLHHWDCARTQAFPNVASAAGFPRLFRGHNIGMQMNNKDFTSVLLCFQDIPSHEKQHANSRMTRQFLTEQGAYKTGCQTQIVKRSWNLKCDSQPSTIQLRFYYVHVFFLSFGSLFLLSGLMHDRVTGCDFRPGHQQATQGTSPDRGENLTRDYCICDYYLISFVLFGFHSFLHRYTRILCNYVKYILFWLHFTFRKGHLPRLMGLWLRDAAKSRGADPRKAELLSCLIWVWVKFVGTSWKDVTNKKPSYHVCRSEAAQIGVEAKVARAEVRAAKAAKAAQAASVGAAAAKAAARAGAKVDDAALPVAEVAGQPFAAWCGLSDLWFHILIFIYRKTIAKPVPGGVASILPTVYTDTRGASPFNPCSMLPLYRFFEQVPLV